ncbi:hypothetical protein [Streptomyces harbinensis]|uniref:hypothetical protein n=1 Tax=Streptomyces harbinensis TaxID=1176198 RepID=UPI00369DFC81
MNSTLTPSHRGALRAVPTTSLVVLDALSDGDAAASSPRAADRRELVTVAELDHAYRADLLLAWIAAQGDPIAELRVMADAIRHDQLTGTDEPLADELLAAIEGDMPEMAVAA